MSAFQFYVSHFVVKDVQWCTLPLAAHPGSLGWCRIWPSAFRFDSHEFESGASPRPPPALGTWNSEKITH